MKRSTVYLCAAACLALTATSGLSADIVKSTYIDGNNYNYRVLFMPDLDQRRVLLGNDGVNHCVPTSCFNVLAYIANQGYPWISPGPGNWQAPANFLPATFHISDLGAEMGTDPNKGTNSKKASQVMANRLAPLFTVSGKFRQDGQAVSLSDMAKLGTSGSAVVFAFGRYSYSFDSGILLLGERHSGHSITLSRLVRSGPASSIVLWSRDPAADGDSNLVSQSPFAHRKYNVGEHLAFSGGSFAGIRYSLDFSAGAGTIDIIDSVYAIRPLGGIWIGHSGGNFKITINKPVKVKGFTYDTAKTILEMSGTINDIGSDILGTTLYAVARPSGLGVQLMKIDPVTGAHESLIALNVNSSSMAVGRFGEVYIIAGTELTCVQMLGERPEVTTINLPHFGSGIAYCDEKDEVVILSAPSKKVMRYSSLDANPIVHDLPGAWNLGTPASLAIHPDGTYFMASAASQLVFGAKFGPVGTPPAFSSFLPAVQATSLSIGDMGDLFISNGATVRAYKHTELAGWQLNLDSPFHGLPSGHTFRINRSRSNYDPAIHDDDDTNIHPDDLTAGEHILDCDADFDEDNMVSIVDLLALLSAWGPCPENAPCQADLTRTGFVSVADLLALLSAWGPCP